MAKPQDIESSEDDARYPRTRQVHLDGNVTTVHHVLRKNYITAAFASSPATKHKEEEEEDGKIKEEEEDDDDDKDESKDSWVAVVPEAKRLPILIVPGFMSSGMEVKESTIAPSLVGKRVWLNLTQLGFNSLHSSGALQQNEAKRRMHGMRHLNSDTQNDSVALTKEQDPDQDEADDPDHHDDDAPPQLSTAAGPLPSNTEELHQEFIRQQRCKSDWLQHMSLEKDMMSERAGVMIRPIAGLAGVDYLTPGALTSLLSYVFGPILRVLKQAGWEGEREVRAATYDWRLAPLQLERRDGYFTNTMKLIDDMYHANHRKPVVVLGHSLGCKTAHYLLNFIRQHPEGGPEWIRQRIHSYIPMGGPHGGAPKAVRSSVDGEKLGLEAFLSDEEGLLLGRSLGSGPWLMPLSEREQQREQQEEDGGDSGRPPVAFWRREGLLQVTLLTPIRCANLFAHRVDPPERVSVGITFGKHTVRTPLQPMTGSPTTPVVDLVGQTLVFPAPPTLVAAATQDRRDPDRLLQVKMYEPGLRAVNRKWKATNEPQNDETKPKKGCCWWCCYYLLCAVTLFIPLIFYHVFRAFFCQVLKPVAEASLTAADIAARAAGKTSLCAASPPMSISEVLPVDNDKEEEEEAMEKEYTVTLQADMGNETDLLSNTVYRAKRSDANQDGSNTGASLRLRIKWVPPPPSGVMVAAAQTPKQDQGAASAWQFCNKRDKTVSYQQVLGDALLEAEGLERHLKLAATVYGSDPLGPRSRSALDRPPVQLVRAIYGINLSTEVGGVYRRQAVLRDERKVQKMYGLDKGASLVSPASSAGYELRGGIVRETAKTMQRLYTCSSQLEREGGEESPLEKKCSGDGTVPYWSLQQPRKWHSPGTCTVTVDELEGAEHREMLADERLHRLLIRYCSAQEEEEV